MTGVRTGSSDRYCRSCYHAASLVCRPRLKADSYRSPRGQQPAAGPYKRTTKPAIGHLLQADGFRWARQLAPTSGEAAAPPASPTRPPPHPLPVTSIAWRIAHLAARAEVYRNWTFEDQRLGLPQFAVPGTPDALNEWVHSAQDRFTRSVDGLD
jgi:hypothetical protein